MKDSDRTKLITVVEDWIEASEKFQESCDSINCYDKDYELDKTTEEYEDLYMETKDKFFELLNEI